MNARIKRFSTLALVALFAASGLSAQESQDEFYMDFLFGEEMVEEISSGQEGSAQNTDPLASLLKREGTRIGGSFSGSLDSVFTWSDLWTGGTSVIDPEKKGSRPLPRLNPLLRRPPHRGFRGLRFGKDRPAAFLQRRSRRRGSGGGKSTQYKSLRTLLRFQPPRRDLLPLREEHGQVGRRLLLESRRRDQPGVHQYPGRRSPARRVR
jgi:hypothetical protein